MYQAITGINIDARHNSAWHYRAASDLGSDVGVFMNVCIYRLSDTLRHTWIDAYLIYLYTLMLQEQVSQLRAAEEARISAEEARVCNELRDRMQHQVQRRSHQPAPNSDMAGTVAASSSPPHLPAVCHGGSSCAEETCKLELERAHKEIEVLDHTVGELIVEIMDMLLAVSSYQVETLCVSLCVDSRH